MHFVKNSQGMFQSIYAINQLFISEAGPSEKFKTEFIKTLMQNPPEVTSILNKYRVIIVPNVFGSDNVKYYDSTIQKSPINYYITSLRSNNIKQSINIFEFFVENKASQVMFGIKNEAYTCRSFEYDYFDIFLKKISERIQ